MNKRKALTLLLSLAILLSLALPAATARADDDGISEDNGDINEVGTEIDGLKLDKTAVYNAETGHYTITLEAYATGASTFITQDIPTDFILVLDQSGSMEYSIGGYTYTAYRKTSGLSTRNYHNDEYYPLRHNGGSENLWHKLNNNEYIAVSVEQEMVYTPISDWNNRKYYDNQNSLYCLVSGEYKPVAVKREGHLFSSDEYWYTVEGQQILYTTGDSSNPDFGQYAPLYQSVKKYTYSYTLNGATTVIEESFGDGSSPNTQFYRRDYSSSAGGTRLNALKNAATTFANAVAAKAAGADGDISTTGDNIDHRIAVVGYADTDSYYGYNTGVFIGSTLNRYETAAAGVYGTALQDMSTTAGKNNVTASINALKASGATRTDYGLTMANGILNANPVPEGETRNRIVIVFTDGSPTDSNGFELNVANAAINNANAIKDSGATVYSIGIFSGADASSAGTEPSGDLDNNSSKLTPACNWFMQQVSSNNGTPQSPSYYLSASDAGTLDSIFRQISQQIQTGGSNTELSGTAVVKDIISPYFTLPAGTTANDIQIDTYDCTGKTGDTYTWSSTSGGSGGATATVNGDQVSVTGFDFAKNWCGTETDTNGNTTVRGKKLVISFTVDPKSGFLGGNDVPTNNTSAGIYKEGETTPSKTFPLPLVNVPIKDIAVTAENKNVYLLGGVTLDDLKKGATVTVGDDIKLDLSKANDAEKPYGLEPWQTAYVNIIVEYKDGDKVLTELTDLKDDVTYTVEVAVAPKTTDPTSTQGETAVDKTGSATGHVNVFKPVLTYKDSEAYYGDNAPTDYIGNLVSEVWKHGDTIANPDTMTGAAPTLEKTYTPGDGIDNGKINTKQDIGVDVKVEISKADAAGTTTKTDVTDKTTFIHTDCEGKTCTLLDGKEFLIHVKTCTLTITKAGNVANEPFVFTVNKDNAKYTEVTIVGAGSVTIAELPVGTYSITENENWSWRYAPEYSNGKEVTLNATTHEGTILCKNTKDNDKWLDGYSDVISNIFQLKQPTTDTGDTN